MCGESELPNDLKCQGYRTWSQADTLCESVGARLCTSLELQDDETKGIKHYTCETFLCDLYMFDCFSLFLFKKVLGVVSMINYYGVALFVILVIQWLMGRVW